MVVVVRGRGVGLLVWRRDIVRVARGRGRRWGGRAVRSPSDVQVFLLLEEKETGRGSSSSFARTLCVCVCDRKSTCVCVRARQRDE